MERSVISKAHRSFMLNGWPGSYLAFLRSPDRATETFTLVDSCDTRLALFKCQDGVVRELRGVKQIEEWYNTGSDFE